MNKFWFFFLIAIPLVGAMFLPIVPQLLVCLAVILFVVWTGQLDVKLFRELLKGWYNIPDPPDYQSWDHSTKMQWLDYKMQCYEIIKDSQQLQQVRQPIGSLLLYLRCKLRGMAFPPPFPYPPFTAEAQLRRY